MIEAVSRRSGQARGPAARPFRAIAACGKQGFPVLGRCVACGAFGKDELLAPEAVGFRSTSMQDPQALSWNG
jgi:hypothetical protein